MRCLDTWSCSMHLVPADVAGTAGSAGKARAPRCGSAPTVWGPLPRLAAPQQYGARCQRPRQAAPQRYRARCLRLGGAAPQRYGARCRDCNHLRPLTLRATGRCCPASHGGGVAALMGVITHFGPPDVAVRPLLPRGGHGREEERASETRPLSLVLFFSSVLFLLFSLL